MTGKTTTVVFITANVGSIFEEPSVMLQIWTKEFLYTIARLNPKFVALHCQEVGGKNYEKSMQYVEDFVKLLVDSEELRLFNKVRVYLDEDYSSAENFTALGNFYFIHESITDALIYDFEQRRFVEVEGKVIYSKNIETIGTKEKSKFPLEYFPECKWSRKGFLRTRWCLNGTIFDLVNIHLFHDVSNFIAIKSFPSVYSDTRRRALAYTLERFQTDEFGPVPLFVFGDFNFRTDTQGVVKHLSEGLNSSCENDEVSTIHFKQEDKVIFSLGKKEFSHSNHQALFTSKDGDWLREFDKELEAFSDQLFEFEISFPPSYPFEENSSGDRCYMKTRCPAWCDRVVLSHSAIPLVKDSNDPGNVVYSIMGRNTCMGDHKPVYLKFDIESTSAKHKWPGVYSTSKSNSQEERMSNQIIFSEDKTGSEKSSHVKLKYGETEIEKLACSLEALMSQNNSLSREAELNTEPDLSRCTSCRIHQSIGRVVNNPGGEEIAKDNLVFEDKKILALLAREIKVPKDYLRKIELQDTGQKGEMCNWEYKLNDDKIEKFRAVKRVNSASLVEHPPKKEDWKNTRCNSDVAWSPSAYVQSQALTKSWKENKQFTKGNSRIRLISSSNSLNNSLPRLTSHHSSSDEEWFEEIEEGDDDVLRMNENRIETEEPVMDIFPEYCGDKGAIEKSVKPATESVSRTNLFPEGKAVVLPYQTLKNLQNVPSDTTSCVGMGTKTDDDLLAETESLTGKSFDGILVMEEAKNKQKSSSRGDHTQGEEEPKQHSHKSNKSKPLSILKRLAEVRKESNKENDGKSLTETDIRESFESLIVGAAESSSSEVEIMKTEEEVKPFDESERELTEEESSQKFDGEIGDLKKEKNETSFSENNLNGESWETIELGGKKSKEKEKEKEKTNDGFFDKTIRKTCRNKENEGKEKRLEGDGTTCCCILQ